MRQQQQQRKSKSAAVALFEALEGRAHFSATISGLVHNDINGNGRLDEFSTTPTTRVYVDANKNGKRDSGELTTLTDANGRYELKDVPPGSYAIRFELPAGWIGANGTARVGQPVSFTGGASAVGVHDALIRYGSAPWSTVGQNAQHTGISPFRGGPLTGTPQEVTKEAGLPVTSKVTDVGFKFGTPLFTKGNTAIVSVYNQGKYEVRAFSRAFGALMWSFVSDYVEPPSVQLSLRTLTAVFQPTIGSDGKLYVPGAGGTVYVINKPDSFWGTKTRVRTADAQVAFYGIENYRTAKAGKFRGHVFINTPLTAAPNGDVYFGVEASGTNPLGIPSSLARVRSNGTGGRVAAAVVSGGAPAVSNDGSYVYVATQSGSTAKIERFRTGSLGRAGSQVLIDPLNKDKRIQLTQGFVSLPVVAPDGDVYLATPAKAQSVLADGNGWLMRFSADLKTVKATNAEVMGTETPAIVPASMVPGYAGKSSYLVVAARLTPEESTYQRLSLFDPAASLKQTGVEFLLPLTQYTGDDSQQHNALGFVSSPVTVDPSSGAIYLVNSSEQLLRWNLVDATTLTPPLTLVANPVIELEGGAPAVIGPDGQVYAVVNGSLVAAF